MDLTAPGLLREACLVDGQWYAPEGRDTIVVTSPADGSVVARVPSLASEDIEMAVDAAERAFRIWSKTAASERSAKLRSWRDLIVANADDLAAIMTAEQGKPLAEARGEVIYAASFIEWFAEEAKRVYGDIIPAPQADKRILVLKQPVGVCAAITPWNFPAAMITRKGGAALAAGCTIIVKPADQTPLTALAIADLAVQAGIPAGVLQVVTGPAEVVGGVLTASDRVRKLSFTGSTKVGRLLMAQCAPTIKRLSLELGGNAPFIVFDDADLDAAVEGAIASKFRNAGQTCVCANRLYVQSGVYDAFARKLADRVAGLTVGPGTREGVLIGPLIDEAAIRKVEDHVADALAEGAESLVGGRRSGAGSLFFEPTVLVGVTQSMRIAREETFGPVAPLFRFETEEEVVRLANDTEFGLASYFYTENGRRAWRVAEALEYGIVGHNTGVISNEVAPFGGMKQSGMGREGSKYGIEEYIETKYWCSAVG
ncbi:succinate-semialdehyde dehydrogenase/glutarate-semialdehyde dehydrogenase [Methylobacterium brachythecii]|uniref:NAD-dependent succinate-semialdehyde dehydrogenase n=1 Tax=Methylobacterium brachythecii TaxID=1176177 RepID=A0A7W6AJM2_9HYPH|nr:succinate-semialdehyde dehydrogenase/glutarate-semialdehyde dehydrogenase [Methylobacterium brachythecii]GLS44271.1 NAD-dependent succinate-semialdehyde dehydrogenase [Methylobacterium brachythecii]